MKSPVLTSPRKRPRLGPDSNGMLFTPEEFDAVRDFAEGYVYELVHGVVVVMSPPVAEERGPNELLGVWLYLYDQDHPGILDGTLPENYLRPPDSRRRADRVIWTGLGRTPNFRTDVPKVVVEFVSEGRRNWQRDYVVKREEYQELGVGEYWIIDRFSRTLTVCRADGKVIVVRENEVYEPPMLPGFKLRLKELLAEADRWAKAGASKVKRKKSKE